MRHIAIVMLVCLIPFRAQAAVCDDVRRLIDMANSDFRQIKAGRDPDVEDWYKTSFQLTNAECSISDDGGGAAYFCSWEYSDERSARAAYDGLAPQIRVCLSKFDLQEMPPRQATLMTAVLAGQSYKIVASEAFDLNVTIELNRRESRRQTSYEVEFEVRRLAWN